MSHEPCQSSDQFKRQKLPYPAKQSEMDPPPRSDLPNDLPAGRIGFGACRGKTRIGG